MKCRVLLLKTISYALAVTPLQAGLVCLFLAVLGLIAAGAETQTLQAPELTESSGIAQVGDCFWSHNDSGDRPRLFVFSADGQLRCEIAVTGAQAVDWEDMCSFTRNGRQYVAVGDVGDNDARRTAVQIYVIEVPNELLSSQAIVARERELPVVAEYNLTYPEGPVNCEALAYDPRTESFVLATKEILRCRLYSLPIGPLEGRQQLAAQWLGTCVLPLVTGGDIASDGSRLVLSTYGPGCAIGRRSEVGREHHWLTTGDDALIMFPLLPRQQGESICFGSDNRMLFLTSELQPTPLLCVPVPQAGLKNKPSER